MSHRKRRTDGIDSDSELEELKSRHYNDLKNKKVRIRGSGKHLWCPYCQDKGRREYTFSELESHASRIGLDSRSATLGNKARHRGLLKYLYRYGDEVGKSSHSSKRSPEPAEIYPYDKSKSAKVTGEAKSEKWTPNDEKLLEYIESTMNAANEFVESKTILNKTAEGTTELEEQLKEHREIVTEPGELVTAQGKILEDLDAEPGEIITESTDIGVITKDTSPTSCRTISEKGIVSQSHVKAQKSDEEPIVWPWMLIVANIPVEWKNGKYVAESGRKLREEWVSQGYNPKKVFPLWSNRGHSGFAIVEFNKDWEGFKNALALEKSFEKDRHGKRDWHVTRHKGEKLYGWLAREEEYHSTSLIGKYIKKNADLKTVSDLQTELRRKDTTLFSNLTNTLETKSKKCEEIKENISKTEIFMRNVITQKEEMCESYNAEMKRMQDIASDQLRKISEEHQRNKLQLEAQRDELRSRENELKYRQALNEKEKREFHNKRKMNEMAILEQKNADEKMLKLAEDQKRQKELLHKKIIDLEAKLDQKQVLELEIQRMKGAVEMMKHISDEGDMEEKKKLESIEEELKEKEEELEDMEALNQTLIVKERNTNDEVQDARKELINGLKDGRANICVKRMGELETVPFKNAAKRMYPGKDYATKAMELCSLWEDHLRDPSWHPYKVIMTGGTHKEVLDEDDEKLKELKTKVGEDVYEAVTTALNELNEYNPSGRYPLPELWNTSQKKKASLKDGIELILKQWKALKPKKRKR